MARSATLLNSSSELTRSRRTFHTETPNSHESCKAGRVLHSAPHLVDAPESLGGNSRTTLIVNCSPATYNELETMSTLRFGVRAKSIKNKAHVNVEMSPAELKALLKKTVAELAAVREFAAALAAEVEIWRSGGIVDPTNWTTSQPAAAPSKRLVNYGLISTPTASGSSRAGTPGGMLTPGGSVTDGSRPETPTVFGTPSTLEKDEREEFLRRENELSDQLAEKVSSTCLWAPSAELTSQESALSNAEKTLADMRDEISYFREQEALAVRVSLGKVCSR